MGQGTYVDDSNHIEGNKDIDCLNYVATDQPSKNPTLQPSAPPTNVPPNPPSKTPSASPTQSTYLPTTDPSIPPEATTLRTIVCGMEDKCSANEKTVEKTTVQAVVAVEMNHTVVLVDGPSSAAVIH